MISFLYTILCIICLCIGFFIGNKMNCKEDNIAKAPIKNPIKTIKEKVEDKKQNDKIKEQLEELNKIYHNIECYDGTSKGQKEVKGIEIGLFR